MTEKRTSKQQLQAMGSAIKRHVKSIVIILLCIVLVSDTLFVGNIAYGVKWITCESQPVVMMASTDLPAISPSPMMVYIFEKPSFFQEKYSPLQPIFAGHDELYCSLDQAVDAAHKLTDDQNITIY